MTLPGNDPKKTVYKSQSELFGQRQNNVEQTISESTFDDEIALSIDLNVSGLQTIHSVTIEGLGVFSYRAHLSTQSFLTIDPQLCKKNEVQQRAGIIVNIRMQGNVKVVSFESMVIIANNNDSTEMNLFVKSNGQDDYQVRSDQMAKIAPKSVFRVPLTWIYGKNPSSLYLKSSNNTK